jgi:DNA-binding NarL/FixJ family response regulator
METITNARILIAGGPELVRRGIRDVLNKDRRFGAIAEVAHPAELPSACAAVMPEVVLLDLEPPAGGPGGDVALEAMEETLRVQSDVRMIIVVQHAAIDGVQRAVRAGARGVLLRDTPARSLLDAVGDVLSGGAALDPRLTWQLFEQWHNDRPGFLGPADAGPMLSSSVVAVLSPREREVLNLLAQGNRNKEIAAELGVSVGTVKTHLRHIFRKLMVADRTAAVLSAIRVSWREAA